MIRSAVTALTLADDGDLDVAYRLVSQLPDRGCCRHGSSPPRDAWSATYTQLGSVPPPSWAWQTLPHAGTTVDSETLAGTGFAVLGTRFTVATGSALVLVRSAGANRPVAQSVYNG